MQELNINKTCCLIITYNPNHILYDLISIIKNQIHDIIVVDNNSEQNIKNNLINFCDLNTIHLILNNKNLGIAKALNQGISFANKNGFEWVLTFDQDSTPYDNIFSIIFEALSEYNGEKSIGAIGVNYIIRGSAIDRNHRLSHRNKKYYIVNYLITSGCLLSVDCSISIGGFREDLFIDNVDTEYCLRLKNNGKVLLRTDKPAMVHETGNTITITFLGLKLSSPNHNSLRRYYMARNHIILSKEYLFKNPLFIIRLTFFFLKEIIEMIILDNEKKKKIGKTIIGICHGLFYSKKNRVYL